jgi:hypothetical protein
MAKPIIMTVDDELQVLNAISRSRFNAPDLFSNSSLYTIFQGMPRFVYLPQP